LEVLAVIKEERNGVFGKKYLVLELCAVWENEYDPSCAFYPSFSGEPFYYWIELEYNGPESYIRRYARALYSLLNDWFRENLAEALFSILSTRTFSYEFERNGELFTFSPSKPLSFLPPAYFRPFLFRVVPVPPSRQFPVDYDPVVDWCLDLTKVLTGEMVGEFILGIQGK